MASSFTSSAYCLNVRRSIAISVESPTPGWSNVMICTPNDSVSLSSQCFNRRESASPWLKITRVPLDVVSPNDSYASVRPSFRVIVGMMDVVLLARRYYGGLSGRGENE